MKNNVLQNAEAISEVGISTAAHLKLLEMPVSAGDPLAAYQQRIQSLTGSFDEFVDLAAREIGKVVRKGRKLNKVVFAGYEAILMDKVVKYIDASKKIIVVPNSPHVNLKRIEMNHRTPGNLSVQEIYRVWEATGHEAIVFVPFFELSDGSAWVYRYCAPILNEHLFSKARAIIGVKLLSELQLEPGYDPNGALSLFARTNPSVFQNIISVEPQIVQHELDNSTHPA
jgi:hypothetical protein